MRGGRYASYERGMRAHNSRVLAALAGAAALLAGIPAASLAGLPDPVEVTIHGREVRSCSYIAWINADRSESALRSVGPGGEGEPIIRHLRYTATKTLLSELAKGEDLVALSFWADADSLRVGSVTVEKGGHVWRGEAVGLPVRASGKYVEVVLVQRETLLRRSRWIESDGTAGTVGGLYGLVPIRGAIPFCILMPLRSEGGQAWENRARETFTVTFEGGERK
ncbi:MAG: hypothetical protein FJY73_10590 [Candidatus Eisenbacteria bacterium]|nr:hypothetical protein [Candidatus Eisenbacteria bacterium]